MRFADARQATQAQRDAWERVRRAENYFARQLRRVASHIGNVVRTFGPEDPQRLDEMIETLHRYSTLLTPWARATARRMLAEVARRDERAWRVMARQMGESIQREITEAPVGLVYHQLMAQQVDLITSLPREAAKRVHDLVTGHLYEGQRASVVAEAIMATGEVTKNRANLIARTETTRAATLFQKARAEALGSEGYVWRTAHDWKVRPLHKKLEGSFHRWDDPPIAGEAGERAHPGTIYNCRCIAEPVLPSNL
jgi:SPP1 gp7 family putative phage head morphogenesis protein